MASVPNMRLSPTARPGVTDQPGDGGEGEGFANLLSTTVPTPGEAADRPKATAASDEDRPATGGQEEPIAQADAILSLVAFQAITPSAPAPASDPPSGVPGALAPAPSSGMPVAIAAPASAPAATPAPIAVAGAGLQPGATAVDPAGTAPTPSTPTLAGAVTVPAATTQASPAAPAAAVATPPASGPDIRGTSPAGPATAATDAAPVLTGPARQAAGPGGQPPEAPLAVKFAGTGQPAPAAATANAAKAGETLAPAQPGPISRTATAKAAPVVVERTAAIAAGAATAAASATPAVTPRSGSRDPARLASINAVSPKGEVAAAQAPAQTATPVVPPFAPTAIAEASAVSSPITGGPAQAAAPEAMIERQLDLAADGEWLDQLARDIARAGGTEGKMRFRLDPEHLGTLRVELAQSERGTSVRLVVESEGARAIIADAQPKLAAEARAQGVRIAETHVDLAGGHAGDPRRQEAERRDPQLRTARESSPAEPERQARSSSDRYA